jgi:hypothetical protein
MQYTPMGATIWFCVTIKCFTFHWSSQHFKNVPNTADKQIHGETVQFNIGAFSTMLF